MEKPKEPMSEKEKRARIILRNAITSIHRMGFNCLVRVGEPAPYMGAPIVVDDVIFQPKGKNT